MKMTLIIVSGLPPRWDMKMLVRKLIQRIKGKFQVLTIKCSKSTRSGYVRLSEILDPQKVVNNINSTMFGKFKLHAIIPDVPPILPSTVKPRELPLPLRRKYHIANEGSLGQVLHAAHTEILEELQSKYAGLFALSKAGGHKLLQAIAEELFSKLRCIMLKAADVKTSLKLTKQYRSMYPHHCDFSVIQSTYNNIERSAGRPICSLNQDDLVTPTDRPYVLSNMPLDKAQVICTKYVKAISKKLQNHITGLKTNTDGELMEEEAVNKVRLELKKIIPYIPMMVQIVVKDNIFQHKSMYHGVRIYGEPFIPNKEMMLKFLRKYLAVKVYRSDRAFNLMYCKVPSNTLPKFAEADGTNICGAIMCIRLSDVEYYKVPDTLVSKMLAFKGEMPEPPPLPADTHADKQDDYESEWSETW